MIWKIARKEILSNIMTMRFTVGTVLFLVLVVIFTYVLMNDYQQKLKDYNELVARDNEEFRQLMTYQNLRPTIYKPPEMLAIFCKGVEGNINNSARVSIGDVPIIKSAAVGGGNPLLSIFPVFDIVLIFKIVISILTFLLAYDSISGEKEDKTLGLMLSNCIPKYKILFGKFIGGMVTISVPIAVGFIVGGIILLTSPMISLSASDWFLIVLMVFVSLIMVGVLFCLGLFISSTTKQSSDTLIVLLFLWVMFVFIIPNVSTYVVGCVKSIESKENVNTRTREIWKEYRKKYNDIQLKNRIDGNQIQNDTDEPWGYYVSYTTKAFIDFQKRILPLSEPLRIEYTDKSYQIERNYLESLKFQKNISDMLSRISPLSIYEILISKLSRTDVYSYERYFEQGREYRSQLIQYLYSINAFSMTRYTCTVRDEDLIEITDDMDWEKIRDEYLKRRVEPIDIDNIPKFHFRQESFTEAIRIILVDTAILVFLGILFFLLAFIAFLRYDVR